MGHGLPGRWMRLSASIPSIGGRTSTLASLSPGVPRPFHANVTLVHRHRSSASLASSASPSSASNAAAATRKNDLQRDMRAGHAIRAIKSAQARTHTRTHACTHTHTHTQNSLVLQCRRLNRGRQPSDVELGARRAVGARSGVGACKCMIVCVCACEMRVSVCVGVRARARGCVCAGGRACVRACVRACACVCASASERVRVC